MIEVHCITRAEEFAGLETVWNELLQRSAADNPFLTHQWLYSWWQSFGGASKLNILICWEKSASGESLVGIFPGYILNGYFSVVSKLRLLGSEVVTSDFLDVIVAKGREKEILPFLLAELRRDKNLHLIELTDLREESPLLASSDLVSGQGWCSQEWRVQKLCPTLPLPEDPADYFGSLSRSVRKNFQYYLRRLEAKGAILEIIQQEEDLSHGLADFCRLHMSRRNQMAQSGIFASKAQNAFYSDVFQRFFRAGWLELAFLNVAGERVAGVCQFNYRNAVYYYQTGYDVAWQKSSVGFVLNTMLIERAIRQGKSFYEFLRGVEEYKYRLGATQQRQLRDLYLTNGSLQGNVYLYGRRLNRAGGDAVKSILMPAFGSRTLRRKAGT
jgi:CelD/BcsL family acetyltransferase involved in cellulose biosynthesis